MESLTDQRKRELREQFDLLAYNDTMDCRSKEELNYLTWYDGERKKGPQRPLTEPRKQELKNFAKRAVKNAAIRCVNRGEMDYLAKCMKKVHKRTRLYYKTTFPTDVHVTWV
jgi:hypothetical protein